MVATGNRQHAPYRKILSSSVLERKRDEFLILGKISFSCRVNYFAANRFPRLTSERIAIDGIDQPEQSAKLKMTCGVSVPIRWEIGIPS